MISAALRRHTAALAQTTALGLERDYASRTLRPSATPRPAIRAVIFEFMAGDGEAPGLVGRGEELRRLDSFLDTVERGPAALVVEGDAGIGKTSLWRAGVEAARARGHHVLTARPAEAERELSFAALGDLLGPAAESIGGLPGPQRRALRVALLVEDWEGEPPDRRAIGVALHSLLLRIADDAPVVVAVDDLQWLDHPSRAALEFAIRRVEGAIGLLAFGRPPAELAVDADRFVLQALDLDAIATLMRERLGVGFTRPTLLQIERASGGNPFYALELARALHAHDGPLKDGEPLPVPTTLHELLARRLRDLAPATRHALLHAAVLGQVSPDLIADEAVKEGIEARVLVGTDSGPAFAHPLLVSVLIADASLDGRRAAHARVARAASDPEERARHLAAAATEPDETIAAALDEAASRARARGAPEAAAGLAEQALRLSVDDGASTHRRRLDAARYHFDAGDPTRARALVDEALAHAAPGAQKAQALRDLGDLLATGESLDASRAPYLDALAEAGDDVALRASIEARLTRVVLLEDGAYAAVPHAQTAAALAEQSGDPRLLVPALVALANVKFVLGRGVQHALLKRALAAGRPAGFWLHQHPRMMLAHQLYMMSSFEEARIEYEVVVAEASAAGDMALFQPLVHLSGNEAGAGRYVRARECAERAVASALQSGRPFAEFFARTQLAVIEATMGDVDDARANIERALPLAERSSAHHVLGLRSVLGQLALVDGRYREAHAQFGPCVDELSSLTGPLYPPHLMDWVIDDIEALVHLDQLGRARDLADWAEGHLWPGNADWASASTNRARGFVAAGAGDVEGATALFEASVSGWRKVGQLFPLGRALLTLGSVQRRAQRRRAAQDSLEEALEIFERLPAPLWAENTRAELRRLGGRRSSLGRLTPVEEEIAALVAAGRSNAEVARALVVSPRTVEWNLTKIYRKLSVHSRTELAAKLAKARATCE